MVFVTYAAHNIPNCVLGQFVLILFGILARCGFYFLPYFPLYPSFHVALCSFWISLFVDCKITVQCGLAFSAALIQFLCSYFLALSSADGMLFGALPKCPLCSGHLRYSGGMYKCHGYLSAWSKCSYSATDIKRVKGKWKIPEETSNEYLLKVHG